MQIGIIIRDKIARLVNEAFAVCGNSDYVIHFDFDSEWDAYETKTARFKYNGSYTDVIFTGTKCAMPVISDANKVEIGVFAGELHTTTPAILIMKKSILCGGETESSVSREIKNEFEKLLDKKIVQPDWNQNDETANDYIKNRPGGYEVVSKRFMHTDIMQTDMQYGYPGIPEIYAGTEYLVEIDGEDEYFVAQEDGDYYSVGTATREEMLSGADGWWLGMSSSNGVSHLLASEKYVGRTLSIGGAERYIEKIPAKYLDINMDQVHPDWEQNDSEAADYIRNRPGGYYEDGFESICTISITLGSNKGSQTVNSTNWISDTTFRASELTVYDPWADEYHVLPKRYVGSYVLSEYPETGYGNEHLIGSGYADTGEKWFICNSTYGMVVYYDLDQNRAGTDTTLTCSEAKSIAKKFNADFLPLATETRAGAVKVKQSESFSGATPVLMVKGQLYTGETLPHPTSEDAGACMVADKYGQWKIGAACVTRKDIETTSTIHRVKLGTNTSDIVYVVPSNPTNGASLCLKIEGASYAELGSIEVGFGSDFPLIIHIRRVIPDYISYVIYRGGEESSKCNFANYSGMVNICLEAYGATSNSTKFKACSYYN